MIIAETARLSLQTWALDDFAAFAPIARDPQVMRFIGDGEPWGDARIGWFMGRQSALFETLGYCQFKLADKASGRLIGFCGIAPLAVIGETEIGWWLTPEFWGQGLAFEAAERVVELAFHKFAIHQLVARAYAVNTRSVRIMQRLGMQFDRILETAPIDDIVLYRTAVPPVRYRDNLS